MRRFFVDEAGDVGCKRVILGQEARHIGRVLRMGPGERIVLMDGKGMRFQALIVSVKPREVEVVLEKILPEPSLLPVKINLCQAVLKSRHMDYAVQKTSELGVWSISPFFSERTVVRPKHERAGGRIIRWKEIAQNSAKQSDRAQPVEIRPISKFEKLLDNLKQDSGMKVIFWEGERSKDFKMLLRVSVPEGEFTGIIGPEGGFSRDEIGLAADAGFTSVSLGKRVLRSETAAVAMVTIVQYEWGDLSLDSPTRHLDHVTNPS